jgi:hypothetical protein
MFNDNGDRLVELVLLGTGSRRMFDTSKIIERKDREMAMTIMADFILLGHQKVGSFALSSDKTELFATALGAWLKEIAAVLNRHALPRLYDLNGWDPGLAATFVPGDIEKQDVAAFAEGLSKLSMSGFVTPGGEADEDRVREVMGLPERPRDDGLGGDDAAGAAGPDLPAGETGL